MHNEGFVLLNQKGDIVFFRIFFVTVMAIFSLPSVAGEFRVSCFSAISDCSSKVSDIVSDKFIARFPASRYKIAVVAEFQPYSDGGGVGYAVAGVSPILKDGTTQFPIRRFSATVRIANRSMNGYDVTKQTEELLRDAVQELMAACERSSDCDVYKPQVASGD